MSKLISLILVVVAMLCSCKKEKHVEKEILVSYGDSELSIDDVLDKMPQGLAPSDSLNLFKAIVDNWVTDKVLSNLAEEKLYDLSDIERKVEEYRQHLIVEEYLKRMMESQNASVNDKTIAEYYEANKENLILEVPLVKGVFLKISSDSKNSDEIKNLLTSEDPESLDKFEQEWLDKSAEYNYFRDQWIDWETITSMIPYRFGDPDAFLENNSYFERDYDGATYILQISDYLKSGTQQPFEFASTWIKDILTQENLRGYQRKLTETLIKNAIKDGKLEMKGYNPIKHEFATQQKKNEKEIK